MFTWTNLFLERSEYLKRWKEMSDSNEYTSPVTGIDCSTDVLLERLAANNVSSVAKRTVNDQVGWMVNTFWLPQIPCFRRNSIYSIICYSTLKLANP